MRRVTVSSVSTHCHSGAPRVQTSGTELYWSAMSCALCMSANQVDFPTEIAFHFPGYKNLDKPHILAFPRVLVCLDCGFSQFNLPETGLQALRDGDHAI